MKPQVLRVLWVSFDTTRVMVQVLPVMGYSVHRCVFNPNKIRPRMLLTALQIKWTQMVKVSCLGERAIALHGMYESKLLHMPLLLITPIPCIIY